MGSSLTRDGLFWRLKLPQYGKQPAGNYWRTIPIVKCPHARYISIQVRWLLAKSLRPLKQTETARSMQAGFMLNKLTIRGSASQITQMLGELDRFLPAGWRREAEAESRLQRLGLRRGTSC